jgi:GxxExxY protein
MNGSLPEKILYKDECYAIQGSIFEVYREMGNGFLEPVYQECLEREFSRRGVPFVAQKELTLIYKEQPLKQTYKPDLVCFEKVIVELKAAKEITDEHRAQLFNYLKATQMRLGLLVNFGHSPNVQIERIIL